MKTIFAQCAIPFCLVLTLLLGACGEKKEEHADSEGSDNDGTDTATTLSAPANLSVTAGDSKVTLDWDAVSGASSYTVYWGTSTGISSSSTAITSISTDNYTHSSLTNDTTYYYKVVAVDSSGTGTLSSEANATPASDGTQMGGAIQGSPLSLTEVSTFAGSTEGSGTDDGSGSDARFFYPSGITTDGTNLYVADSNNHTIRKILIATGVVSTLAGTAETSGSDDGEGTLAKFNTPEGITTDGTNLYVSDTNNHTIRKIVIATKVVSTLAGTAGTSGSDDGDGTLAKFNTPNGITTDGTNLYVADMLNNTIRKIVIATGAVSTLAGTAASTGSTDGSGTEALFKQPKRITTDGTNLYVADTTRHTIRKIVIATKVVSTLAGTAGTSGSINATGTSSTFNRPTGITTDGTNLYVVDSANHTIRKIVIATEVVSTLAATAGIYGSDDGDGTLAKFNTPEGITTDGTNLYVADRSNNTIRKIVIATGTVTTLSGEVSTEGIADGTLPNATFSNPTGITTDGTKLYVSTQNGMSHSANFTIRMIQ